MSIHASAVPDPAGRREAASRSADEILESEPDLAERIRSGDASAIAEFFESRGARVTSVRDVGPAAQD